MATIRKVEKHGRVRWRVSSYDALGQRHQRFFATKGEADVHLADVIDQAKHGKLTARMDPKITLQDYAAQWLPQHAADYDLKPRTVESYESVLRVHVLPVPVGRGTFGALRMTAITRPLVLALLGRQRAQGGARESVRLTHAILSTLLETAVLRDGLLAANPAHALRKILKLTTSGEALAEAVRAKAMDQAELDLALATARTHSPLFRLFVVLARCGLRIGEALALQDADLDLDGRRLRVNRSLGRKGRIGSPKSGHARAVDISVDAVTVLRAQIAEKKKAKLARAFTDLPLWTFPTAGGGPHTARNVLRHWHRVQALAGLLDATGHPRFGLKSFRHSFASLHILHGANLAWLQEQLGHANIDLTRRIYGSAFKMRDLAAADQQDRRSALVVTEAVTEADSGR